MTVGNGATQHVEFTLIHFACGMCAAQHVAGKTFARHKLHVCQRLRGKGFMHINQREIGERQPCAIQRQRRGPCRSEQHVLPDINGGKGVATQIAQRCDAKLFCPGFGHQDHGGGTVRQRRTVSCGYRTVFTVKGRAQLRIIRQRRGATNVVIFRERFAVRRHIGGHHFVGQFALRPGFRCQLMRAMRQCILLFAGNTVGFCHLLGSVAHAQAGGVFSNGRWHGHEVTQA